MSEKPMMTGREILDQHIQSAIAHIEGVLKVERYCWPAGPAERALNDLYAAQRIMADAGTRARALNGAI